MKTPLLVTAMAAVCLLVCPDVKAQYKAPSQYFPKNFSPSGPSETPDAPKAPDKTAPAKLQPPKFKDLGTNAQFYFLSDTNRTVPWMKISATTAKNTKNGITRAIPAATPVAK